MKSRRGFTLIEVMVAGAILAMAFTALFGLFSSSIFNLGKIEDVHRYQLAGEEVLTRVIALPNLPAGGSAEGSVEGLNAKWEVGVSPWIPPDLEGRPSEAIMKIDVKVSWPGRQGEQSLKLEAVRSVALSYENYDFAQSIETAFPR